MWIFSTETRTIFKEKQKQYHVYKRRFLVPGYFIIIFDCVVYTSNDKITWNKKTPLMKKTTLTHRPFQYSLPKHCVYMYLLHFGKKYWKGLYWEQGVNCTLFCVLQLVSWKRFIQCTIFWGTLSIPQYTGKADFIKKVLSVYTHSMTTIFLSLSAQVAIKSTFFMKSPVTLRERYLSLWWERWQLWAPDHTSW